METMMEGVTNLVDDYLSTLMVRNVYLNCQTMLINIFFIFQGEIHKHANVTDETVKLTDIRNICTETYPPSAIFSTVRSKKSFDKVLKEKFI